jgi:hypothetical protein
LRGRLLAVHLLNVPGDRDADHAVVSSETEYFVLAGLQGIVRTEGRISPAPLTVTQNSFLYRALRGAIFKLLLIQETAMDSGAVSVHFDSGHLFLDLSDGQAVEFPLGLVSCLAGSH